MVCILLQKSVCVSTKHLLYFFQYLSWSSFLLRDGMDLILQLNKLGWRNVLEINDIHCKQGGRAKLGTLLTCGILRQYWSNCICRMATINRSFVFQHISPGAYVRLAALWFLILWNRWSGTMLDTALQTTPAANPAPHSDALYKLNYFYICWD